MASVGGQKRGGSQWGEVYEGQEAGLGGDGASPEEGTFEQSLEHCQGMICMSCFLKNKIAGRAALGPLCPQKILEHFWRLSNNLEF